MAGQLLALGRLHVDKGLLLWKSHAACRLSEGQNLSGVPISAARIILWILRASGAFWGG